MLFNIFLCFDIYYIQPKNGCQLKSAFQLDHCWHAHKYKFFFKLRDNQKCIFQSGTLGFVAVSQGTC